MSEYVGILKFFRDLCHMSGCETWIDIRDHKLNKNLGILELEVICGARKRDRKLVLLSQGAKEELLKRLRGEDREREIIVKFIERVDKIPKIVVEKTKTNDVIVIAKLGSGFRGGVDVTEGKDSKILYSVAASQAGGSAIIAIIYIKDGGYVMITRSGRLYGSPPEMILYNNRGSLVYISREEFDAIDAME